ncbi:MAG: AAA family ATPase [Candidatus Pacebacteria bacterium]|nr:AAA family ATPase [Candidatus Paceibacterota bacterium]
MFKVVFIVGMPGSGKTIVSDCFVNHGFFYLRFGQIVLDEIKDKGLEISEDVERKIREGLRKKHGQAAFALLNIPKIDKALKNSSVIADGLYSWSEYKLLKKKYKNKMIVIAVFAPPELRYERLEKRPYDKDNRFRPIPREKSLQRDYAEIENIEKGGPIAMADFTILNTGTEKNLRKIVKKIINDQNL